ncbi:MAG: hypothetical protein IKS00_05660 [Bacteroidales bacterium]|nr:hypothetical protein [Bacteroidales bacterium]
MAKEQLSQSKISLHSLRNDMLSVLVSKLEGSSKLAKQTGTKDMIKKMSAAAAIFNEARNKETTITSTKASKDYFTILKNRYTALSGAITSAINGGVAAEKKAALSIKEKFVRITSVFATRTDAIAKLETVIVGFRTLPESAFETINGTRYLDDMVATIKEYHAVMSKRVDVKVEKNNAVQKARMTLIETIQGVTEAIRYAQVCLDGAETELVKAYNTVFNEIASALKKMGSHKKEDEDGLVVID